MPRIAVIGLGLIGGSIALALKQAGLKDVRISGTARSLETMRKARKLGAVDDDEPGGAAAVRNAALVIVATPIVTVRSVFEEIAEALEPGAVVTDVSSTKGQVQRWAKELLPETAYFVGGHPMAGKETAGIDAADPALFRGKPWVIVPSVEAPESAVNTVVGLAQLLGARPFFMDADEHDSYVAAISHLPLAVSSALFSMAQGSTAWPELAQLASSGFRDTTRLASGSPEMSHDIMVTNRDNVLHWIERMQAELSRYRDVIAGGDTKTMLELLRRTQAERDVFVTAGPPKRGTTDEDVPRINFMDMMVGTKVGDAIRKQQKMISDSEARTKGQVAMTSRRVEPARRLRGSIAVPGDKSISHRAAILNALADGDAVVHNFLTGADCLSTLDVLRAVGVECSLDESGKTPVLTVRGAGLGGLREAADTLDCGNSGTTMRLMSGVLAGCDFLSVLTGDTSLRTRPMARIVEPLRQMGARIDGRDGGRLAPLSVRGGGLHGISYRLPVASAQTKSAILLAGLLAEGETTVEEGKQSRDHTERMLAAMGADLRREGPAVRLTPGRPLSPLSMRVPNDISAAAFWMVAAATHPDAEVRLEGVGINPTRAGVIDVLRAMGADVSIEEERTVAGEPAGDVVVRSSELRGVEIGGETVLRAIDEMPALAIAAACASGETVIRDASELRVKESDRISDVASQLRALGVSVEERDDGMTIAGGELKGGEARSFGDHRLAMALAIAGLAAPDGVTVEGAEAVAVSYPGFWDDLAALSGEQRA